MQLFIKIFSIILITILLNSCAVSVFYEYDYGKNNKPYRYMELKENQFTISVKVSQNRNEMQIGGLSKYNAPTWIKDTISEVNFIKQELSFPDGTILEKKSRPMTPAISKNCRDKDGKEIPCLTDFYTCDNFKKKLRKYKHLNLKLVYTLDSLGEVTQYKREYELVKKKYYRFAVH